MGTLNMGTLKMGPLNTQALNMRGMFNPELGPVEKAVV